MSFDHQFGNRYGETFDVEYIGKAEPIPNPFTTFKQVLRSKGFKAAKGDRGCYVHPNAPNAEVYFYPGKECSLYVDKKHVKTFWTYNRHRWASQVSDIVNRMKKFTFLEVE